MEPMTAFMLVFLLSLIMVAYSAHKLIKIRKPTRERDHFISFIVGCICLVIGVGVAIYFHDFYILLGAFVMVLVSLIHKDKWRIPELITWSKMSSDEKLYEVLLWIGCFAMIIAVYLFIKYAETWL
ncbi:hypothetical protein ACFL96_07500 [Thermoproteota archaeon]